MKALFEVTIERYETLNSMPESWPVAALRALLDVLEVDTSSLSDEDLNGYALMALQELEPEEAASIVLTQTLGGLMTPGQIRNLREEMKDDRKWEDSADMRTHEPIFNAQILLGEAFPATYSTPDVVRLTALVRAIDPEGEILLGKPMTEPLLVRMLADGMPDSSVLKRLFDDALIKGPFPEASQILWQYRVENIDDESAAGIARRVVLYSPKSWMGPLKQARSYTSSAFPDRS